jgi:hypothetical protein
MKQPERAVPFPASNLSAAGGHAAGLPPVWRYGLLFGGLSGLFAVLQLVVSETSAVENRFAYSSAYYGVQNQALDPTVIVRWLGPVLTASYTSCLIAFGLSMWLCWHAGRATAEATGRRTLGALAGMLASGVGSLIWIVASVAAVLLVHTDGTLSGVFTSNPTNAPSSTAADLGGLLLQEVVAGLLALGFAAVAGRMGAASAPSESPARSPAGGQAPAGPPPGLAYYGGFGGPAVPPQAPAMTAPPARPFVVAPMYPPPPDLYGNQQAGMPYGYPPASPYPPYPAAGYPPQMMYPAYPGYPPAPWPTPPGYGAPPPQQPAPSPGQAPPTNGNGATPDSTAPHEPRTE